MGPEALAQVLRPLAALFPAAAHPDVLVGLGDPDDAAVVRIDDARALVATTDFFPPVVDDPYDFGAIAAANAMSDVFAMGGEVLLALNLMAFPDDLDPAIAGEILRGGAEKVREAGGVVAGGHTVVDKEPKFGLAVIGLVAVSEVRTKGGARPGDVLVLTKPLGTGLVTTALKLEQALASDVEAATASMKHLNRAACRVAVVSKATAMTDITGFGLVGHGLEMARAGGVGLALDWDALPLLPGAIRYAEADMVPGGTSRNEAAYYREIENYAGLSDVQRRVLFDPQTSGGLLVALPPAAVAGFAAALAKADPTGGSLCTVVGEVTDRPGIAIRRAATDH